MARPGLYFNDKRDMSNIANKIRLMQIQGRSAIGPDLGAYIIAEIGTNHNRSFETAKAMLHAVADAGCDCAKFQIYEPDEIVSGRIKASDYGLDALYGDISARDMFEHYLKTPKEWFPELRDLCHALGMDFAATIHGEHGLGWAKEIGLDFVKIASMDHTNLPFLKSLVNKINVPILVSLGMASLKHVDALTAALREHAFGFGLFHCCAVYPPELDEVRLANIPFLIDKFALPIGFSDHAIGVDAAIQARGVGAMMFEKHVTMDHTQPGPDHSFAMEMPQFKEYVSQLKKTPWKCGVAPDDFVGPSDRELLNRVKYVKSIITRRALSVGHLLTDNDVYLARPGTGLSPVELPHVLGRTLVRPVEEETPLQWEDFELDGE
ncbi:MAG: N-acetylneuraminate synthase family protein [Desulfobulbaceae bacterium]|nr:N-acetylneuraminate synthase family protein [Desulfobulbaceae bacterium]